MTLSSQLNQGNAIKLDSFNSAPEATTVPLAPVVNAAQGNDNGRYAWWIGDEGTKARVDLARPENPAATERDRLARSQTPHEAGLANINPDWAAFAPVPFGTIDKTALASMGTASLAAENLNLGNRQFAVEPGAETLLPDAAWKREVMEIDLVMAIVRNGRTRPVYSSQWGNRPGRRNYIFLFDGPHEYQPIGIRRFFDVPPAES